jgi:hypothetical protein
MRKYAMTAVTATQITRVSQKIRLNSQSIPSPCTE